MKFGQILLRRKLISPSQLEQALAAQPTKVQLGKLLTTSGLITEKDVENALLEQHWRQQGMWVID